MANTLSQDRAGRIIAHGADGDNPPDCGAFHSKMVRCHPASAATPAGRRTMPGTKIKIRSREGGKFDCYLATPAAERPGPRGHARRENRGQVQRQAA
jgi:hypothetical protein